MQSVSRKLFEKFLSKKVRPTPWEIWQAGFAEGGHQLIEIAAKEKRREKWFIGGFLGHVEEAWESTIQKWHSTK